MHGHGRTDRTCRNGRFVIPEGMRRHVLALILLAPLGACMTGTPPPSRHAPVALRPPPVTGLGITKVMGVDAQALVTLFGSPALDVREGPARKLQFRGAACVLDAYLYPQTSARGPATVRWIDARTPAGGDIDRASCIAALQKR